MHLVLHEFVYNVNIMLRIQLPHHKFTSFIGLFQIRAKIVILKVRTI